MASPFYQSATKSTIETSYRIRVIHGRSNPELAASVAKCLGVELCRAEVGEFANGETSIKIKDNVRGDDCYVIQPTTGHEGLEINTALMELLLLIHTLRLSSAKRITAVVPYYAYSRQDRKAQSRVPISASAVAQLMQSMGVDRVVTLDLHCGQIQGFFRNMPCDNLQMSDEFVSYIKTRDWFDPTQTCVVSPDAGGVERATIVANGINASHIVTILKRRVEANKVESMQTVGTVEGFNCIIVDDMVDTAGTLVKACQTLKEMGAKRVIACATHGILTEPASTRINECAALDELVVSDSIPQTAHAGKIPKLTVLTVAPLLSQAIKRSHSEQSISDLFKSAKKGKE
jgi:ribose-phosphate pyrophosphokinase